MPYQNRPAARACLAAVLAVSVALSASPSLAKPDGAGRPDFVEGKGSHGNGNPGKGNSGKGNPGRGGKGGPEGAATLPAHGGRIEPKAGAYGPDADRILGSGASAAVIAALLGGQTQTLSVGAKPLPPGIRKNLARGKPLPPGIARQSVPQPLLVRLPVVDGHEWIRIGTELVLVGIASHLIAQVIDGVFS
ncbi:anti-virulence regulator CigR family protein [Arenibaculum pallidiluteum]|uniref:anti-virulence regulator CigR family protein n=1 Tax=Arenibaculum pallidiluteum TaxID=2812559 RepID=UPI001A968719|nr:anti-virulence regulator CigR family protein [Arenibaculum pallidiluteum]